MASIDERDAANYAGRSDGPQETQTDSENDFVLPPSSSPSVFLVGADIRFLRLETIRHTPANTSVSHTSLRVCGHITDAGDGLEMRSAIFK
ncbi:hypothetical protein QQF64_022407 [Cirrhinus molitorella]|uniref:Uncharacterized protein n=1 Tax=Cirrhinus molitorella TaxID=172907 RepID=A0ABR3LBK9_9TELE